VLRRGRKGPRQGPHRLRPALTRPAIAAASGWWPSCCAHGLTPTSRREAYTSRKPRKRPSATRTQKMTGLLGLQSAQLVHDVSSVVRRGARRPRSLSLDGRLEPGTSACGVGLKLTFHPTTSQVGDGVPLWTDAAAVARQRMVARGVHPSASNIPVDCRRGARRMNGKPDDRAGVDVIRWTAWMSVPADRAKLAAGGRSWCPVRWPRQPAEAPGRRPAPSRRRAAGRGRSPVRSVGDPDRASHRSPVAGRTVMLPAVGVGLQPRSFPAAQLGGRRVGGV
jgi:hypothetical protein